MFGSFWLSLFIFKEGNLSNPFPKRLSSDNYNRTITKGVIYVLMTLRWKAICFPGFLFLLK